MILKGEIFGLWLVLHSAFEDQGSSWWEFSTTI